ncbi:hypothetical protein HHI36_008692, partial [Cryptolaemus montrouzieri]
MDTRKNEKLNLENMLDEVEVRWPIYGLSYCAEYEYECTGVHSYDVTAFVFAECDQF